MGLCRDQVHVDLNIVEFWCCEFSTTFFHCINICSVQMKPVLNCYCLVFRMWGIVHWLECTRCGQPFHCTDLVTCAYHSGTIALGKDQEEPGLPLYSCCGRPASSFSPMTIVREVCIYSINTVLGLLCMTLYAGIRMHLLMSLVERVSERMGILSKPLDS